MVLVCGMEWWTNVKKANWWHLRTNFLFYANRAFLSCLDLFALVFIDVMDWMCGLANIGLCSKLHMWTFRIEDYAYNSLFVMLTFSPQTKVFVFCNNELIIFIMQFPCSNLSLTHTRACACVHPSLVMIPRLICLSQKDFFNYSCL